MGLVQRLTVDITTTKTAAESSPIPAPTNSSPTPGSWDNAWSVAFAKDLLRGNRHVTRYQVIHEGDAPRPVAGRPLASAVGHAGGA